METPPVPWINTLSPGLICRRPYNAFHAVRAAQGKVAPSSRLRFLGSGKRPFSGSTAYSRSMPSIAPPNPVAMEEGFSGPYWWVWLNRLTTLSPAL